LASEWSDRENSIAIVAYLQMLSLERQGQPYSKRSINLEILRQLHGRSRPSIEYKHANISAVLRDLGFPYVQGYKPRSNYQHSLLELVRAALAREQVPIPAMNDEGGRPVSMHGAEAKLKVVEPNTHGHVMNPELPPESAFQRLQKRAFGGGDVAARPGAEDDAWWPKGPPLAGIPELTDAFIKAVDRQSGLTMVFLLGGAGNGKSFAARDLTERLGMPSNFLGGLARRSYIMRIGRTHVEILNDATIAPSKDYPRLQEVALAEDIQRWEAMTKDCPVAVFCCVNRGIIVDEVREIEARGGHHSPFAKAVLAWLASPRTDVHGSVGGGPAPDMTITDHATSALRHFNQQTVEWDGKRACVAALSVDASSLTEVAAVLGGSRAGILFSQVVDRCKTDLTQRPDSCPIKANVRHWLAPGMLDRWVKLIQSAEIASGRPHSYREIWGLAALSITGPKFVEDGIPTDVIAHVDRRLEGAKAAATDEERLAHLLDLARFRSNESLFRAPYPNGKDYRVDFPPPTPAHQGLALVDPSVWGSSVSKVVEDALQAISVGERPSRHLMAAEGFENAWSPFDDALEQSILAYVINDESPDTIRRKLVSWWGGYLLRLFGLATGNLGNAEVTEQWIHCDQASRGGPTALPVRFEESIRTLLYPQQDGALPGTMRIAAFAARVEPLRELRDGSPPLLAEQVNLAAMSFQVSRQGGRLMLDCMRQGTVVSQMVLDFSLMREALACRQQELGQTEASVFIEPRIERSRSASLQGIPAGMRQLVSINGGKTLEIHR
jgi:hypothetical protein